MIFSKTETRFPLHSSSFTPLTRHVRHSFSQKLLDAGAEVNNALTQWQTARKTMELDHRRTESLESAVRSTQKLMRHGTTNYLEVLTAQQTLLSARLTEVTDKYDEIQGVINLYHALGGGA